MARFLSLLLFTTLLSSYTANAEVSTLIDAGEGHHATALKQGEQIVTLTASETGGLLRLKNGQRTNLLQGSFGQLDTRQTSDDEYLIALLDVNSQATRLVVSDLNTAHEMVSIPAGRADIETLCLGYVDTILMLFRADAAGQLHQTAIFMSEHNVQLVPVRTLNIGPGIKACSVHDDSQTLYLADEFAGVWAMSANQESDAERRLLAYSPDASIEGVSISRTGLLGWVGPDASTLHVRDITIDEGTTKAFTLAGNVAPEMLHMDTHDTGTIVTVYDDNSGRLKQFTLSGNAASQYVVDDIQIPLLKAVVETKPVERVGDAADDPAIWINKAAPGESLIVGTDKKSGLNIYSLSGEQRQSLPVGRVNNVDIRYNWQLDSGEVVDIAAASNRSDNSISLFGITPVTGDVRLLGSVATNLSEVYGLCLFQREKRIDIFINDTDGRYQRYQLENERGNITADLLSEFRLPSQPEGCVADDKAEQLFMGEESSGIWLASLKGDDFFAEQIIQANTPVKPDIEGMALYTLNEKRYLIVSSQGNNRYAVYETQPPYSLLGVFGIEADWQRGIDGVSETDGLDATSVGLGNDFPEGILVVQDGRNVMPTENQNFKLVDGSDLRTVIQEFAGKKR